MIFGKDKERFAALEEDNALLTAQIAQLGADMKALTVQNIAGPSSYESLTDAISAVSVAGPIISPETALRAATVFACTRLLSEAVAGLPLPIYERTEDGGRNIAPLGAANGIGWLLNERPTAFCSAASFWEWMVTDSLLRGDGIAIIGRDRSGRVLELVPVPRNNVVIERVKGRLRYYVNTDEGFMGFDQDDVLHFPGFGFNGVHGMSVIQYAARQAIGIALASEEFAARFFSNGATPKFALEVPGALKNAQVEDLRAEFQRRYTGTENAHLPLVLTHGVKASQLSLNAEDAQLLQTRMFQVVDICRAFGVPPFMIGETDKTTTWGSGIEHMGLGFVRYTLKGPLQRAEQEMNYKFWPRSTKFFTAFDTDALMRGDSAAEATYFRAALGGAQGPGWMSVNQIRRVKNWPKVPGGDAVYMPPTEPKKETPDDDDSTARPARDPDAQPGEDPRIAPPARR